MGTWGTGPFDNDTAADWLNDFEHASFSRRIPLIRAALTAVVDCGDGYLDADFADEGIAAAAIVAAQLSGGSEASLPVLDIGVVELPEDIAALALRALDRIVSEPSEWQSLRAESPAFYARALQSLEPIRAALGKTTG